MDRVWGGVASVLVETFVPSTLVTRTLRNKHAAAGGLTDDTVHRWRSMLLVTLARYR